MMKTEFQYRDDVAFLAEVSAKHGHVSALIASWSVLGAGHSVLRSLTAYRAELDRLRSGTPDSLTDMESLIKGLTITKRAEARLQDAEPEVKNYIPNRTPNNAAQELARALFNARQQFHQSMQNIEREFGLGPFAGEGQAA